MSRGTGWWQRGGPGSVNIASGDCSRQRVCGEKPHEVWLSWVAGEKDTVFRWEFGARLAAPLSGERAETAVTYSWYPRGNPSQPLTHKIRLFHTKVPKGILFNSAQNQCKKKKKVNALYISVISFTKHPRNTMYD